MVWEYGRPSNKRSFLDASHARRLVDTHCFDASLKRVGVGTLSPRQVANLRRRAPPPAVSRLPFPTSVVSTSAPYASTLDAESATSGEVLIALKLQMTTMKSVVGQVGGAPLLLLL